MSKALRHTACPDCGSKDNLAIYEDHEHCYSQGCGRHVFYKGKTITENSASSPKAKYDLYPLPTRAPAALKHRGISQSTVGKYKVTADSEKAEAIFPRFTADGQHIANQIRYDDKGFSVQGPINEAVLFGQTVFNEGGRSITITEGYYDTLAAFQLTGSRYPNVGVMSASSAKSECVRSFEYLDSFDQIVINFDNDTPGKEAAVQVAQLFAPGKVRILTLPQIEIGRDEEDKPIYTKDANDFLVHGLQKEYINQWHQAPVYVAEGLVLGNDQALLTDIVDYQEPESVPFPWEGLNKSTYGLRLGELTLFLADTGIGKTTFMKEIEYKLLKDEELERRNYGVGFLHLEETKRSTALGLMSIHNNKPYHLPDTERTREELIDAYNEVVATPRVVIWDHFGSNEIDVVLSKIRHMVALGCRYIVIDHLSIIVSDQSGDERKQLDEISTKLKTLTMNLNICVICVMHINRQGQARGSAGPEQVANNVIRLERDKKEKDPWRRNVTMMLVEKCRLSGRTGPSCWVFYNEITNRLEELSKEQIEQFESGGNNAGHEFDSYKG